VRPNDRPGERITASRIALVGPFAWAAKKQRREAVLSVKATWGQALLLVHNQTPLDLEAALSALRACIGRTTSDELMRTDSGIDMNVLRAGALPT
jgi:hypothetical protein